MERSDCSSVTAIGVDETSSRKRYNFISSLFDLDDPRLGWRKGRTEKCPGFAMLNETKHLTEGQRQALPGVASWNATLAEV